MTIGPLSSSLDFLYLQNSRIFKLFYSGMPFGAFQWKRQSHSRHWKESVLLILSPGWTFWRKYRSCRYSSVRAVTKSKGTQGLRTSDEKQDQRTPLFRQDWPIESVPSLISPPPHSLPWLVFSLTHFWVIAGLCPCSLCSGWSPPIILVIVPQVVLTAMCTDRCRVCACVLEYLDAGGTCP